MTGIDRQRREDRLEVRLKYSSTAARSFLPRSATRSMRIPSFLAPAAAHRRGSGTCCRADVRTRLRMMSSFSTCCAVGPAWAVMRSRTSPTRIMRNSSRLCAAMREELHSLQQRDVGVLRLAEDAAVELDPAQLPVEEREREPRLSEALLQARGQACSHSEPPSRRCLQGFRHGPSGQSYVVTVCMGVNFT